MKHTQIDEFGYEFGINAIEDDNYRRFIEFSLDLYKNMYAQINLNLNLSIRIKIN